MLRNRQFRMLIITMISISLIGVIVAAFYSLAFMVIMLLVSIALIVTALLYNRHLYNDLEELSRYLRHISAGDFSLDVRDNYEGELSILKSNIYKVTSMLTEQSSLLQKDKIYLSDAISDISHQLKTPLTSMMIMAELLANDKLPLEKRTEFTNNIQTQLERSEWLVSSLLKLSKIDAGAIIFKENLVQMSQLIEKATEHFLIKMDIKEQTLAIIGDQSIAFSTDLNWTAEALINLMKNAIEHTPQGGKVTFTIRDNPLYTEIIIADNGSGIPKEDIPYLFQRFYKGRNASDCSVGIGLAMARQIVRNQNGDIEVTSVEGKGTAFKVKFYK